jgi:hypothetical protein
MQARSGSVVKNPGSPLVRVLESCAEIFAPAGLSWGTCNFQPFCSTPSAGGASREDAEEEDGGLDAEEAEEGPEALPALGPFSVRGFDEV